MNKNTRKAIVELLPAHAFDSTPLGDDINAEWTTKEGKFSLTTKKTNHKEWGDIGYWIVLITNHDGESVTLKILKIRDHVYVGVVDRVREALVLLGAGPEDGR